MAVNTFYNLNLQKFEGTEMFIKLERKLHDNRWYKPILDYLEVFLNVNRVYLALGVASALLFGLLFQYNVSLVTSAIGFIYPLCKTLETLEKSSPPAAEKRWLIYWIIHAALNFAEIFFFLHWLPGYWIIKSGFLYWCYAPIERNGSDAVYACMIQPFFQEVTDNQQAVRTSAPASCQNATLAGNNMDVGLVHAHQN